MTEKTAKRKLGLRGEVLLYIGFLWLVNGWVVSQTPLPTGRALALHELLPIQWRLLGWTITGGIAIFFAFKRWPGKDRWGFGALVVMPAERTISWLLTPIADAAGWLPDPMHGPPVILCLGQAVVWGVVAWLIYRIGASRQMLVVTHEGETIVAQGTVAELKPSEQPEPGNPADPEAT